MSDLSRYLEQYIHTDLAPKGEQDGAVQQTIQSHHQGMITNDDTRPTNILQTPIPAPRNPSTVQNHNSTTKKLFESPVPNYELSWEQYKTKYIPEASRTKLTRASTQPDIASTPMVSRGPQFELDQQLKKEPMTSIPVTPANKITIVTPSTIHTHGSSVRSDNSLQLQLAAKESTITSLQRTISHLEARLHQEQQKISNSNKEKQTLDNQYAHIAKLESIINEKDRIQSSTENKLHELQNRFQQMSDQVQNQADKIYTLESENIHYKSKFSEVNAKNSMMAVESSQFQQQLKKADASMKELRDRVHVMKEQLNRLESEYELSHQQEERYKALLGTQNAKLAEYENQIQLLQQDRLQMIRKLEGLNEKLQQTSNAQGYLEQQSEEAQRLKEENDKIRVDMEKQRREILSGQSSIKALKESIKLKDQHAQSTETERKRLGEENVALLDKIEWLNSELGKRDLEIKELNMTEPIYASQKRELEDEVDRLKADIRTYQLQHERDESQIQQLEAVQQEQENLLYGQSEGLKSMQNIIAEREDYIKQLEQALEEPVSRMPNDEISRQVMELTEALGYHEHQLREQEQMLEERNAVIKQQQQQIHFQQQKIQEFNLQDKAFNFLKDTTTPPSKIFELEELAQKQYEEIENLVKEVEQKNATIDQLQKRPQFSQKDSKEHQSKLMAIEALNQQLQRENRILKQNSHLSGDTALLNDATSCLQELHSLKVLVQQVLEGKQDPNLSLILVGQSQRGQLKDQPEGDSVNNSPSSFSLVSKVPTPSSSEEAILAIKSLVSETQSMIANKYAEQMGNECTVQ